LSRCNHGWIYTRSRRQRRKVGATSATQDAGARGGCVGHHRCFNPSARSTCCTIEACRSRNWAGCITPPRCPQQSI